MQQSFSKTMYVDQTPTEVFNKLKNVRSWWTGIHGETIKGNSDIPGEEFTFNAGGGVHYSKHKLVELEQDKSIGWEIKFTICDLPANRFVLFKFYQLMF